MAHEIVKKETGEIFQTLSIEVYPEYTIARCNGLSIRFDKGVVNPLFSLQQVTAPTVSALVSVPSL